MVEGVAIPDNREQRFEELARGFVEGPCGGRWEDVPPAAREALLEWLRQCFYWAVDKQN